MYGTENNAITNSAHARLCPYGCAVGGLNTIMFVIVKPGLRSLN